MPGSLGTILFSMELFVNSLTILPKNVPTVIQDARNLYKVTDIFMDL